MNSDLQRIQATLNQLSLPTQWNRSPQVRSPQLPRLRGPAGSPTAPSGSSSSQPVTAFTVPPSFERVPALPQLQAIAPPAIPEPAGRRPHPLLAMNLLRHIEATVLSWQDEIQQLAQQIEAVYQEGPMIDGWLEADTPNPKGQGKPQPVDINLLLETVQVISRLPAAQKAAQSARLGYRLCGIDEEGRSWSHPCPWDELPDVTVAIARYQTLRNLSDRKQKRELQLSQVTEALLALQKHLEV